MTGADGDPEDAEAVDGSPERHLQLRARHRRAHPQALPFEKGAQLRLAQTDRLTSEAQLVAVDNLWLGKAVDRGLKLESPQILAPHERRERRWQEHAAARWLPPPSTAGTCRKT